MCGAKPPPRCTGTERFTYKSWRNSLYCLISSLTWVLLWPQETLIYCLSHKCKRGCVMPPGWKNPDVFRWVHIMDWPSAFLVSSCGWGWLWERVGHQVSSFSITSHSLSQRISGFLPLCFNTSMRVGWDMWPAFWKTSLACKAWYRPLGSWHRLEKGHLLTCGSPPTGKHECHKAGAGCHLSLLMDYLPFPLLLLQFLLKLSCAELRLAKPLLTGCFFFF